MRGIIGRLFGFDREIEELKERIRTLSWDDAFGVWTRSAFLHFCEVMPRGRRSVVLLDFESIHELNARMGYRWVDERIRSTFAIRFRSSDIIARWYSGDEIVILFDGTEEGARHKMRELEAAASVNGLAFRHEVGVWRVGEESVRAVVDRLAFRLCTRKSAGNVRPETRAQAGPVTSR